MSASPGSEKESLPGKKPTYLSQCVKLNNGGGRVLWLQTCCPSPSADGEGAGVGLPSLADGRAEALA